MTPAPLRSGAMGRHRPERPDSVESTPRFGDETWRVPAFAALLSLLSGCAALTPTNVALEAARSDYRRTEMSEQVFLFAGPELEDAGDALNTARKAWLRRASKAEVDDFASIVVQRLVVARRVADGRITETRKRGDMP